MIRKNMTCKRSAESQIMVYWSAAESVGCSLAWAIFNSTHHWAKIDKTKTRKNLRGLSTGDEVI